MKSLISILAIIFLFIPVSVSADILPSRTYSFDIKYNGEIIEEEICIDLYEYWSDFGSPTHYAYLSYDPTQYRRDMVDYSDYKDLKSLCLQVNSEHLKYGLHGRNSDVKKCTNDEDCGWKDTFVACNGQCYLAIFVPSLDKTFYYTEQINPNYPDDNKSFDYHYNFTVNIKLDGSINFKEDGGSTLFPPQPTPNNQPLPISTAEKILNHLFSIQFLIALLITIFIELIVIKFLPATKQIFKRLTLSVVGVNIISLSLLWSILISLNFFFTFSLLDFLRFKMGAINFITILVAEFLVIIFESIFIYLFNKKYYSFGKFFLISLSINLASFILGGFIYLIF